MHTYFPSTMCRNRIACFHTDRQIAEQCELEKNYEHLMLLGVGSRESQVKRLTHLTPLARNSMSRGKGKIAECMKLDSIKIKFNRTTCSATRLLLKVCTSFNSLQTTYDQIKENKSIFHSSILTIKLCPERNFYEKDFCKMAFILMYFQEGLRASK